MEQRRGRRAPGEEAPAEEKKAAPKKAAPKADQAPKQEGDFLQREGGIY